ncbi:MAG: DnaJ domain-containing protein [Flammeovirgaceae bacterium]
MKNLYDILEIGREATNAEIKAAYKRLAAEYHPDRNNEAGAEERFKEINQAYQILSDFYLRLQYEKELDAASGVGIESNRAEPEPVGKTEEIPVQEEVVEKEAPPAFGLKWKLAILATPILILLGIGVLKFVVVGFGDQAEAVPVVELSNDSIVVEAVPTVEKASKTVSVWELKRMAVANPDHCILYIDSIKGLDDYKPEMEKIRQEAVRQLPQKTAYFFETNECERAEKSFELLKAVTGKALSAHLQKQLDFYRCRCAIEVKDFTKAMNILADMEQRYKHQYSILAAKAQVIHYGLNQPKEALTFYKKARLLYEYQTIDQKFLAYWKPDFKTLSAATLIANEAEVYASLGEQEKAKLTALESIALDSNQALPYEIIGNSFIKEENTWGACKYWRKALENGSSSATDSLLKYCEE